MSNLLNKASILTTATGYGDGVVNSILPNTADGDFDFIRNSTATRVNSEGLIEDVPYNLVSYSESFATNWTLQSVTLTANQIISPDGNLTGALIETTSTGACIIRPDSLSLAVGKTYSFSVFVKKGNLRWIRTGHITSGSTGAWFDLENGVVGTVNSESATIEEYGNNWYRITNTFVGTSTQTGNSVFIAISDNNGSTNAGAVGVNAYIWGAQLVKGDQPKDYLKTTDRLDIPRIDYTNGEPSILLEPSSTNLMLYSQDFSQTTWTKSQLTQTSNSIASPDGTVNASLLTITSGVPYLAQLQTLTTGVDYTITAFVKKGTNRWVRLAYVTSTTNAAWFDLDKGVVGTQSSNSVSATIEKYPNDWYRISNTITSHTSSGLAFLGLSHSDNSTSATDAIGNTVYAWGFQIEQKSYPSSYIQTSGSAVTRSADTANNAGNSDLINSTEGVLYAEFKGQNDNTFNYISVSDGGTTNYAAILCSDVDNEIAYRYYVSNSGVQIVTSVSNLLEFNKIAVKWKVNDFSIYINGVQVGASTSGSVNSAGTFNNVSFARGTSNNTPFYGNFKSVMVFKEALTDLELEKLTGYNNHELYMNYYNRLSYLGLAEEYNVESDINNYIL